MVEIEQIELLQIEDLRIPMQRYKELEFELTSDECPECSIFSPRWHRLGLRSESDADFLVPRFLWWQGKNSYRTLDVFLDIILPSFLGTADLVIYVHDKRGSHQLGYRLLSGKVRRHAVTMTLGAPR